MNHLFCLNVLLALVLLTGCTPPSSNQITQIATLDGLLAGVYDGEVSLAEISDYGDFGLGTYQALDGEMIFLDGVFYQVKEDGSVQQPPPETLSPFAAVVDFEADTSTELPSLDLDGLKKKLDDVFPDQNSFIALRIEGDFESIQTRSVGPQSKPYPTLAEVIKTQSVFNFQSVKGTLVGFRFPPFVGRLNVPGYHFHFLTEDRSAGGHVVKLKMKKGQLQADTVHEDYVIRLPQQTSSYSKAGNPHERSSILEASEIE